jgi:hypothetical protein
VRHGDNVVGCDRPRNRLCLGVIVLGLSDGGITFFALVLGIPDKAASHGPGCGADQCASPRVPRGVPDDGACRRSQACPQKRPGLGIVHVLAAAHRQHQNRQHNRISSSDHDRTSLCPANGIQASREQIPV